MNKKSVVVLSITAAALAAVAVHLQFRLNAQRPDSAPRAAVPPTVAPGPEMAAPPASTTEPAGATAAATRGTTANVGAEGDTPPQNESRTERQLRQSKEFLSKFRNPAERNGLRESALQAARRSSAGADRRLDLSEAEYERVVQLLAEYEIEKRAWNARCIAEPPCMATDEDRARHEAWGKAMREVVGEGGMRKLYDYRRLSFDREAVDSLQVRLPESAALTIAQADDLTRALSDERSRQSRAIQQNQEREGFGSQEGVFVNYAKLPTVEQMYQSGEASAQAIRDRAATILTPDQLVAFNRMYDDLMIAFRKHLRMEYDPPAEGSDTP